MEEFYQREQFQRAIETAEKHKNVAGVDKYILEIENKYQDYLIEMEAFGKRIAPIWNSKIDSWNVAEKRKKFCKIVSIVSLIVYLIFSGGSSMIIVDIIRILANLSIIIGVIGFVVFKVISSISKSKRDDYFKSARAEAKLINNKYLSALPSILKKIDDLYLESLEPVHRETVLMRRDQLQQHEETLRMQRQHQETNIENIKKGRMAQEQLLEIEKERERRYEKNGY